MAQVASITSSLEFFQLIKQSVLNRLTNPALYYRQLFGQDQSMPEGIVIALDTLKRVLAESVVVCLYRLLDRAESQGRENLSIRALQKRLCAENRHQDAECICKWFSKHEELIQECKLLRNRYVGHLDAATYKQNPTYQHTNHEQMFKLLDLTENLLNHVGESLGGSVSDFSGRQPLGYDGGYILGMLKDGDKYRSLKIGVLFKELTLEDIKSQMGEEL